MNGDLRAPEATLASWHTVSISWNHVICQPEVDVCISSKLLLFVIKSCLSLHSLQGKFGHNISQRKCSFFISYCRYFQREWGRRCCKCHWTGNKSGNWAHLLFQMSGHRFLLKKNTSNPSKKQEETTTVELEYSFENCEVQTFQCWLKFFMCTAGTLTNRGKQAGCGAPGLTSVCERSWFIYDKALMFHNLCQSLLQQLHLVNRNCSLIGCHFFALKGIFKTTPLWHFCMVLGIKLHKLN